MGASFLITLREGLEAALIVGITLGMLRRMRQPQKRRFVWLGVAAASVVSIGAAAILQALGVALEGPGEELFEGIMMLLAAIILTTMIFWLQRQGRQIEAGLEADVQRTLTGGGNGALFLLAFVAVVREGIETALFLTAASFDSSALSIWAGAALGLALAIALGWVLFVTSLRLNLGLFFRVTGILLLLFAAGLVANGVHELQEAGALPIVVEHLYDVNSFLDEDGPVGSFLQTLLGYNGNPSLLEVIAYGTYGLVVGGVAWRLERKQPPVSPRATAESPSSSQNGAVDRI